MRLAALPRVLSMKSIRSLIALLEAGMDRNGQENHDLFCNGILGFYMFCSSAGWWYTNPSEKYEFVSWDDDIRNMWTNRINVPNHQPDLGFWSSISSFSGTRFFSWFFSMMVSWAANPFPSMLFIVILQVDTSTKITQGNPDQTNQKLSKHRCCHNLPVIYSFFFYRDVYIYI